MCNTSSTFSLLSLGLLNSIIVRVNNDNRVKTRMEKTIPIEGNRLGEGGVYKRGLRGGVKHHQLETSWHHLSFPPTFPFFEKSYSPLDNFTL